MDNEFEKWSHRWSLREQANHQRIAAAADQTHNHVIIWADERIEALEKAARKAVDAVRFQKPEHERAAIDALAALVEAPSED